MVLLIGDGCSGVEDLLEALDPQGFVQVPFILFFRSGHHMTSPFHALLHIRLKLDTAAMCADPFPWSTLRRDRGHVGDNRSVFRQQEAVPCCAPRCRRAVAIRIGCGDAASGSTPANGTAA
ncbi:hypothetical protein EYF80_048200 [Liparis tanakae]|uniref:Uncharacterized protein n=1 Tax=Liparis tanakae TaxID=230148 RepID=A0A4Z2FK60_9TELE|nr:hypothetical protein EYF80_048200 [Liparis tanakae]